MQGWIHRYVEGLGPAEFHLQVGIVIAILCFLVFRIYRTHHRFRFIKDTATSRIASAAQGYVELKGRGELMPGSTITSPFSRRDCLWYQCIVEKRQHLNDNHTSTWVEVSSEISDQLFLLRDDSGDCVIIPQGALVIPTEQHIWYGHSAQARFLQERHSGWFSRFLPSGKYRFSEGLILESDPLYVTGLFETHQRLIQADAFKHQVEALIDSWRRNPRRHLAAFDVDNNGKIQQQEWVTIRNKAESIIRARQAVNVHHLLRKPQHGSQPFMISALPENLLLKKKRWQLLFELALFFLLLYVLLSAMNAHTMVTQN